ncbi:hypothetical protein SIAM614_26161 [Stappia aggregata IAM 12614]|uniref:Uncharacterized protein n=1 Tax=Roseibium aggregatum (strain ATCC 25650 / DSM 13394 / JCM 20685 / NBRC 16684 / NCIMB 2208 / IAM 12614 / B1) TaxID=384765 RepID=A0NZW8_ROSAI|nr:hypothetical protein SIAM614_26161 [Stappia aggregata IAM 12614] [Roseibium aggregatum IAM 12614]
MGAKGSAPLCIFRQDLKGELKTFRFGEKVRRNPVSCLIFLSVLMSA